MHLDQDFMQKMAQGFLTIQRINEIEYQYNFRELVYQCDKVKLYHYKPTTKKINNTPLLIVFATVNRPEILDLLPEVSFIRGLLDHGEDVYLLEWGFPDKLDKGIGISDYVTYLQNCTDFILEKNELQRINLLGICQGGLFSLCFAAITKRIKNLILISTPIDFHTEDNLISKLLENIELNNTENISGNWLTQFFISLRPFELIGKKYLHFVDQVADENYINKFLRVEKWLYDAPDQTQKSFAELTQYFYKSNGLIKKQVKIRDEFVDLTNVDMPILNIMATKDHIVPISASNKLKQYVGSSDYMEQTIIGGHIGIYINDKTRQQIAQKIVEWLRQRDLTR